MASGGGGAMLTSAFSSWLFSSPKRPRSRGAPVVSADGVATFTCISASEARTASASTRGAGAPSPASKSPKSSSSLELIPLASAPFASTDPTFSKAPPATASAAAALVGPGRAGVAWTASFGPADTSMPAKSDRSTAGSGAAPDATAPPNSPKSSSSPPSPIAGASELLAASGISTAAGSGSGASAGGAMLTGAFCRGPTSSSSPKSDRSRGASFESGAGDVLETTGPPAAGAMVHASPKSPKSSSSTPSLSRAPDAGTTVDAAPKAPKSPGPTPPAAAIASAPTRGAPRTAAPCACSNAP
mmetsp:Transcript_1281/g.5118  ORF Transcript_1281/g.5118 Transcript_1281/m.5118 type:complete len:301 (+) Transcript_1281:1415-2317(+)